MADKIDSEIGSENMTNTNPEVTVAIVTYNSEDTIDDCLDAVVRSASPPLEILVVDNASTDSTMDRLRLRAEPNLIAIHSLENAGFARGCNMAVARASGHQLLMLNPDTIVDENAIRIASEFLARNEDVGAVGALTFYEDGTVNDTCCFAQPSLWSSFLRALGLSSLLPTSTMLNPEELGGWDRLSTRDVGVITGCFLMIDRALYLAIGGFDEQFFMYSEDTDLSRRLLESGRRCVHLADARVIHHGGRSDNVPALKMVKVLRARTQFYRKHWSPFQAWLGVRLLDTTVAIRAGCSMMIRRLPLQRRGDKWVEVWAHRSEWRAATASGPGKSDLGTSQTGARHWMRRSRSPSSS